jgi:hypothetical protein
MRTARIEPFEAFLIKEIFAPVPTLFILNKVAHHFTFSSANE